MKLRGAVVMVGLSATWAACSLSSASSIAGFGGSAGPIFDASASFVPDTSPGSFACGQMACPAKSLAELAGPHGIAVDRDGIYVTGPGDGTVTRLPRNGTTEPTFTGQDTPWGVAIDTASLYWTNLGAAGPGSVMRAPKVGGQPQELVSGLAHPRGIAVDETGVYVAVAGGVTTQGAGDGGVDGAAEGGVDAGAEAGLGLGTSGAILWLPVGGGPIEVLATSPFEPDRILVDATNVWWTEPLIAGAARIMTMPKGGPSTPQIFADMQPVIVDVAMDAVNLYWLTGGAGGSVSSMPKNGGSPMALVMGLDHATALTTDGVSVWWANSGARPAIMMSDTNGNGAVEVCPSGHVVAMAVDMSNNVFWTTEAAGTASGEVDVVSP
jgi:hypothetical protein